MDDRFNTISGWVLGAGIVALGASIVTGEVFKAERPEKMGYPIEGVVEEGEGGAEAEQPIAVYLATATAEQGANVFKKCAACHTDSQGGPNGLGPNLWATMGKPLGHIPGFAYSDALKAKGGTWTFDAMNDWLKSPKTFVPGTKMTFAGLSKPEERAAVMIFLNNQGSNLPLPPPPAAAAPAPGAEGAAPADGAAPAAGSPATAAAEAADAGAEKAPNQPQITEAGAAKQPAGNVAGDAAPNKGAPPKGQ